MSPNNHFCIPLIIHWIEINANQKRDLYGHFIEDIKVMEGGNMLIVSHQAYSKLFADFVKKRNS